jgi:hypothetical protein
MYSLRDSRNHPLEDKFDWQQSAIRCLQSGRTTATCTIDIDKIDLSEGYWSSSRIIDVTYFSNDFKKALDEGMKLHLILKGAE